MRAGWYSLLSLALIVASGVASAEERTGPRAKVGEFNSQDPSVEMFKAIDDGQIEVKFIALSDRAAQLLITNKTKQALNVKIPDAFAGVPADVLAQNFGGGGGGQGGGGFGGGGGQGLGGGGGGGQQGGGGGGGFFNVAPEVVGKVKVDAVCLDHGKPDPTPKMDYVITRPENYIKNPETIALLKEFGKGTLDHGAVQAAVWHMNNGKSWDELANLSTGRKRLIGGDEVYFSVAQIKGAMQLADAAKKAVAEAAKSAPVTTSIPAK